MYEGFFWALYILTYIYGGTVDHLFWPPDRIRIQTWIWWFLILESLLLCKGGSIPAVNAASHSLKSAARKTRTSLNCGVVATLIISKVDPKWWIPKFVVFCWVLAFLKGPFYNKDSINQGKWSHNHISSSRLIILKSPPTLTANLNGGVFCCWIQTPGRDVSTAFHWLKWLVLNTSSSVVQKCSWNQLSWQSWNPNLSYLFGSTSPDFWTIRFFHITVLVPRFSLEIVGLTCLNMGAVINNTLLHSIILVGW